MLATIAQLLIQLLGLFCALLPNRMVLFRNDAYHRPCHGINSSHCRPRSIGRLPNS